MWFKNANERFHQKQKTELSSAVNQEKELKYKRLPKGIKKEEKEQVKSLEPSGWLLPELIPVSVVDSMKRLEADCYFFRLDGMTVHLRQSRIFVTCYLQFTGIHL